MHPDHKEIIPERTFSSSSLSGSAIVSKERSAIKSIGGHSLAVGSASGIVADSRMDFYHTAQETQPADGYLLTLLYFGDKSLELRMALSAGQQAKPEGASYSPLSFGVAHLPTDYGPVGGAPRQFNGSDDESAGTACNCLQLLSNKASN